MSLKILLADDSMTAQNMGKKILVEGGYEVITVSNGAAAVRKIAEQKPDIVILDIYMPGYTGLEVCERIRQAVETVKTPVLLTVGKMEPFKAEDSNRVKADGVLVKPFEASDLLAAIHRLSTKIQAPPPAPPAPAPAEKPVHLEQPVAAEFPAADYEEWKVTPEEPLQEQPAQPIAMPRELAATPAFGGLDVLDTEPAPATEQPEGPPAVLQNAAAYEESLAASAAAGGEFAVCVPEAAPAVAPAPDKREAAPVEAVVPEEPVREISEVPPSTPAVLETAGLDLELAKEESANQQVQASPELEIEFTGAPAAEAVVPGEILPELEPSVLQESIPVEIAPDAELVTDPTELAQFATKFGVENPEDVPVGIVESRPAETGELLKEEAPVEKNPQPVSANETPEITPPPEVLPQATGLVPAGVVEEVSAPPAAPAAAAEPAPAAESAVSACVEAPPPIDVGEPVPVADAVVSLEKAAAPVPAAEPETVSELPAAAQLPEESPVLKAEEPALSAESATPVEEAAAPILAAVAAALTEPLAAAAATAGLAEVSRAAAPEPAVAGSELQVQQTAKAAETVTAQAAQPETVYEEWQPISQGTAVQEVSPAEGAVAAAEVPTEPEEPKPALEESMIADIVSRVIDKMKPELIAAIARQLGTKK